MSVWQLLREGGFIMCPLVLASVLAWAVAIEKFYFLSQISQQIQNLFTNAAALLKDKKVNEAKGLAHQLHPILKGPYLGIFEWAEIRQAKPNSHAQGEELLARRLSEGQAGLKRYMWIIGTVGSTAPFIGLFGTVVGIIKSFDSIAKAGKSGFAVVAADLSEALVATAAGILVAVVAVVLYNYFTGRLARTFLTMKNRLEDLKDLLAQNL